MKASFAIAPNFHVKGSWSDRLLVAGDDGWRAPREDELARLTTAPAADDVPAFCLFSVPTHLSARFWAMLGEEAEAGSGDFVYFSEELAEFLAFKNLPPPKEAVCELLIQNAGGKLAADDVWALINFGEDAVLLAWPGLQLRLNPGEGFQTPPGQSPDVVPPADDELNVLLAVRPNPA